MKRLTQFFARLAAGKLSEPCDFLEALRRERAQAMGLDTTKERFFQEVKDGPRFDAPSRLAVGIPFFTTEGLLRRHNMADWQNTPSELRLFAARFVEAARRQSVPLYVHSAFRTEAEQDALVAKGRSKAHFPRAPHCQGAAVDIVHGRYHWELTPQEWGFLGKLGKDVAARMNLEVRWGGDFPNFYDPAHWELLHWRDHLRSPISGEPLRLTPRRILADLKGL